MNFPRIAYIVLLLISAASQAASLYDPANPPNWTTDPKAARIGDPLTVIILESSSAESRADSSEQNDYALSAALSDSTNKIAGGVEFEQDGGGKGRTTRGGLVRAQITVQVVGRTESGDLAVRGNQNIVVNGEKQMISVEGVVRPLDIASDNSVLSTRLMNADISFNGQGWVSDTQKPGWLRRLMRFIGL
ncbi:MAG: flagellar basal body L-ring protein FlgH [Hyphomonadaceae bacterium]|nr:flagellar basal body L-ring protein FlgH [Hyphomonadaceae bacterium]